MYGNYNDLSTTYIETLDHTALHHVLFKFSHNNWNSHEKLITVLCVICSFRILTDAPSNSRPNKVIKNVFHSFTARSHVYPCDERLRVILITNERGRRKMTTTLLSESHASKAWKLVTVAKEPTC